MEKPISIVTGSSRGIGRAIASHYLERGHIVIGISRSAGDLEHDDYHHYQSDIADEKALRATFDEIESLFGTISNLINNAGISSLNHSLLMPIAAAKKIFDVNFFGCYIACQEAARLMQKKKHGRIVNFSSIAVKNSSEGLSAYASSKAAVEQLTKILAKEYAPFGITVNCVAPSFVETDLSRGIPESHRPRLNKMSDVIKVVDFCISGAETGRILDVP